MQEEVEHKTVNFAISTTKLTARTFLKGAQFLLRQYDKNASQGKQSMKRLIRQNRGVTNVEIEKTGIKGFAKYAKRYHIDYAVQKDISCTPPRYMVYFKAQDTDALSAAFKEWSKPKPEPKQEHTAQQPEAKEVHQKSAQQLEAERQQNLENLRAAMQKQICTIHADVELPAGKLNDSGSAEQKLHVLLYKSTLPENDLNRALDELRTERRRQKAEYQGAPFADVFLVNLILSDEDSERACIVDVGDTGMSYVIPWSSIPQELQQPLRRYVAQADGKLCGYCKEDLCNTENGRMIVELYLGKQEHHVSRI